MFTVYKRDLADVEPLAYLEGDQNLALGSAATLAAGKLSKAAATTRPDYIVAGAQRADGTYPAMRVLATTVFAAPCAGAVTAGSKLTLATAALGVTTTTTNGVFTVENAQVASQPDGKPVVTGRFA